MANPFMTGNTVNTEQYNTQKEFKEYAWDFNRNNFIYNNDGSMKVVTRNEAIKVWVYKVLQTERFRYGAYYDDYGLDLEKFIGKVPNNEINANELYNAVKETLLVNPYILAVNNISVEQVNKKITLNLELTTVYGKSTQKIEV